MWLSGCIESYNTTIRRGKIQAQRIRSQKTTDGLILLQLTLNNFIEMGNVSGTTSLSVESQTFDWYDETNLPTNTKKDKENFLPM